MLGKPFFKPFKGDSYEKGYCGVKTLVLGASYYCTKSCEFHNVCTKESISFDKKCPLWINKGRYLSDSSTVELDEYFDGGNYYTYDKFLLTLCDVPLPKELDAKLALRKKFWNQFCFYNYIQHFLPNSKTPDYWNNKELFWKYKNAFEIVVNDCNPCIIIVWGAPLREALDDFYLKKYEKSALKKSYHIANISNGPRLILFFDHPSAPVSIIKKKMQLPILQDACNFINNKV